jgi:hypothetical protein
MTHTIDSLRSAILAAILLAVPICVTAGAAGQEVPVIQHQRVLWMENPSEEAVISWTTRTPGKDHRVYFDTQSHNGDPAGYANHTQSFRDGTFTMVPEDEKWVKPGHYHHVHLKGLQPATTYYFVIASDGAVSREFHFVTALADDRPFALMFGGDSRIGTDEPYEHNDRRKMNLRMSAALKANPSILALVHGGDYCQRAQWRYLDAWLSDHELTMTDSGRMLPIIPTRGNHDVHVGFTEMFAWPDGPKHYYYSIKPSPEVALVVLNTEISLGGDQRKWLNRQLPKLRPSSRWLFVSYHQPAYPSVRNMQDGASRRDNWVPLFEEYNVDLVCESHDHALKRTLPIRKGEPDHNGGITYIGDGGLGVPQRKPDPSRWWFASPGFTKPVHHFHLLEFAADGLRVRALGMEGETLDDFTLKPRAIAKAG